MSRKTTIWFWTIAFVALAVLLAKTLVADVYHVDSGSMEPAIAGARSGGERVLVRYDRSPPERFDLVVLLRSGESTPIVKRVVGLPGESVRILQGDLVVNGERLAPDAPRPAPVLVFDDRAQKIEDYLAPGADERKRWNADGGVWTVDATDVPRAAQAGMMFWQNGLKDDYLALDGSIVRGATEVNDCIFECEVRADSAGGAIRIGLAEQGDVFEFSIEPADGGRARVRIVQRFKSEGDEELVSADVDWKSGAWQRVRCSNVDNALALEIGEHAAVRTRYEQNHPHHADRLQEGKSFGERLFVGGDRGRFSFQKLRVWRDLCYTQRGQRGVTSPIDLGPAEYFVLGDHSAESRDSREWGPVHKGEILGRPEAVVWPLAHARWLEPTGEAEP
ncbi:MAG: signal peptidase I [Planctomycetota bacterium]